MADPVRPILMTADPVTLGPTDTLAAVMDLMDELHIRHVPIVDAADNLLGLVSHRDATKLALGQIEELPVAEQRDVLSVILAEEVMTRGIEVADPDMDIREVAELMLENKFGCMPVCEGQRLVGILTEADFVRFVLDSLDE